MAPEDTPTATRDALIQELRGRIDEIDRSILELVNERLQLVLRIKERKVESGIDFVDPGREDAMLRDLLEANRGPLSDAGVEQLLSTIVELGKRDVYGR
jgi:3-deoxy-7-phosphoheptulonate synthase/chorismate mutase